MSTCHVVWIDKAGEVDKFSALQEAARVGFADIDQGRFVDVADSDLDRLVNSLGRLAADRIHGRGQPAIVPVD